MELGWNLKINGVRIFPQWSSGFKCKLASCPFQKEIYLLITEEKLDFHVSLLSNVSCCIFRVSHVVVKEIIISLNHVRACMFIARGVLGSCKRGTGWAKRDLELHKRHFSCQPLLHNNFGSLSLRGGSCQFRQAGWEREHAAQRGSSFYY
jgi:hypothetical protein